MDASPDIIPPGNARVAAHSVRATALLQLIAVPLVAVLCLPLALHINDPWVALLTLAIVLVCTGGAAGACGEGARPMSLLFWVFIGTWLGFGSLYQLAVDQVPWGDAWLVRDTGRVLEAQAITLLALLAFIVGSRLARGKRSTPSQNTRGRDRVPLLGPFSGQLSDPVWTVKFPRVLVNWLGMLLPVAVSSRLRLVERESESVSRIDIPRIRLQRRRFSPAPSENAYRPRDAVVDTGRALLVAGGCCLLGLALLPRVAAAAGGLSGFFTTRASRATLLAYSGPVQDDNAADGFLRILPGALALAAAFIALTVALTTRRRGSDPDRGRYRVAVGIAVVGVLLLTLYANPFTSSRYISVSGLGALALVLTRPRSRRGALVLATFAVVGLLLVYPLAYGFRDDPQTTDLLTSPWDAIATNDFDGFQQVVNTLQFVEEHGLSWGAHLTSAALYLVPRSIWTDKARPASLDVAENRGYEFIDLSLPLHAEFYLDTGLIGMVVLMVVVGLVWARLDDAWLADRGGSMALLVPYLCLAQLGILRGPLGSLVPVAATTTVLLLLGLRGRGPARAAPEKNYG
jgi:hypothetical protein